MDDKFRSRKFMLTGGVQMFACIALAWGWLSGAEFTQITMVCVGAYNVANAAVVFGQGGEHGAKPAVDK
jgi:hypothetical protein